MNLLCRIAIAAACAYAAWWSGRMAWADWLAASGRPDGLERAVRLEPQDTRLVSMQAIQESESNPDSDQAGHELRHALELNRQDSGVLMALGLRAELRGNQADAEHFLVTAAAADRQFKPAWALANYYLRAGRTEKVLPLVERCLHLDPLGFDTPPLFDLAWAASSDADRILALIPKRRPRLIEYMGYLVRTERFEAGTRVWPLALAVADPSKPEDAAELVPWCAFLVRSGHVPQAAGAWNDLVGKSLIHSGRLYPATGVSLADPAFAHVGSAGVFGWQAAGALPGMFVRDLSPSLIFELDGAQPETLTLLRVLAPVLPGRTYRMQWSADSSRLNNPRDAGFAYRLWQDAGQPAIECPLLAAATSCKFVARTGIETLQIELQYSRAPGTVRSKGSLRLLKTWLEFGS